MVQAVIVKAWGVTMLLGPKLSKTHEVSSKAPTDFNGLWIKFIEGACCSIHRKALAAQRKPTKVQLISCCDTGIFYQLKGPESKIFPQAL